MKLAVYLSAVPAKAKNQAKRNLLERFAHGAKAAGDEVWLVDDAAQTVDADVAVIQGWIGMKQAPHLEQRRRVIETQSSRGKHTLAIDSNLFGFLDPADRDRYLRYSLNGIFPTTGYYFQREIDPARWQEIKSAYGFHERPWRQTGRVILICLQRDGGWSMDGLSVVSWLDQIIPRIRQQTNRPIVIRPHPGSLRVIPDVQARWAEIEISSEPSIQQDLDRAWCTVTYNSSPGVASILWGVPAFVTDPQYNRSQAMPFAATDIDQIENPLMPNRSEFYHRLAQCHFATANLADGLAWQFMRARLP